VYPRNEGAPDVKKNILKVDSKKNEVGCHYYGNSA
jgi:hypothetical protein